MPARVGAGRAGEDVRDGGERGGVVGGSVRGAQLAQLRDDLLRVVGRPRHHRLDAPGEDYQAPHPAITAEALCDAIGLAAAAAAVVIEHQDQAVRLGFGTQTDTRIIRHGTGLPGTGHALNGVAVANYIAKYATKALTAPGLPSCRLHNDADIERLRCPAHYQRLITTAWQLGTRYRAWAHTLGYGGHFLTKSRRYSVTFGQLRAARTEYRRAARPPDADRDAWGRPLDETVVLVLPVIWTYAGTGRPLVADAELALASAARARQHRHQADHAV